MTVGAHSEDNEMLEDEEARGDTVFPGEDSMVMQQAESKQEHAHAAVPSLLEDGHLFGFPIYNDHFE